jgi:hypothetical protein
MNDFIKEELGELKFYTQVVDSYFKRDGHRALMNKIQSMIENYCEHENIDYHGGDTCHVCLDCNQQL